MGVNRSLFEPGSQGQTYFKWPGMLLTIIFVTAALVFTINRAYVLKSTPKPAHCKNQLKILSLALSRYHDAYDSFPPSYIADEAGKPMHSWRVLLLPFLESSDLYEKYRFDEPWDGANNRELHSEWNIAYRCPGSMGEGDGNCTSYVAVVGSQTAWSGAKPVRRDEITDDPEQTILLVEMKNSGIHWMEPRDLNFDDMSFEVNDPAGKSVGSWHDWTTGSWFWKKNTPIVNVAYVEGRARRLPRNITPKTLKALLTIRGGETIDPKDLEW